ncbi:hypothetical protein QTO34_012629 [Cnephaeus nilssonii]|uniref:Uncharacterized protein n=1 Tax=Cnephaeus nilssonii TaxID=3371016 RepID=A0AA40HAW6_CNENI|nr:hypothetical protein QTO34_012629 [Eptesicus nilssonii]
MQRRKKEVKVKEKMPKKLRMRRKMKPLLGHLKPVPLSLLQSPGCVFAIAKPCVLGLENKGKDTTKPQQ